jgi:hypothetical protein
LGTANFYYLALRCVKWDIASERYRYPIELFTLLIAILTFQRSLFWLRHRRGLSS